MEFFFEKIRKKSQKLVEIRFLMIDMINVNKVITYIQNNAGFGCCPLGFGEKVEKPKF
jgi:hypothetical protein